MNLLDVKEVTKSFGNLSVVNKLSFEVKKGEILGIAGPNGAGKTTLFNLITGVYNFEGKIFFQEENISTLRPYIICQKGIARSFQLPLVFPTMTVYENINIGAYFGKRNRDDEKKIIREILNLVVLQEKAHILAKNLRLFDKKMTMLAAALATRPKLLLLDEPAGGLSAKEIDQSVSMFKKINSEFGISIIIIEHLMKVLLGICQRMMILQNGEQICIGLPENVMKNKKVIEVYLGEDYA
jgi:branched-chain amino acid transport system ATP-binding protein